MKLTRSLVARKSCLSPDRFHQLFRRSEATADCLYRRAVS